MKNPVLKTIHGQPRIQSSRPVWPDWWFAGMILAVLFFAPAGFAAAPIDYLDLNGTASGFDNGQGAYSADLTTTSTWSTDATGVAAPGLFVTADQIQIGGVASDFSGESITLNMNYSAGSMGASPGVFNIVSTNVTVTMSGTANCRWGHTTTWTVASGSTLIVTDTGNNNGFNFNAQTYTLAGGGTMNFLDAFASNEGGSVLTENMPGGRVNLSQTATSNFGSTAGGGFTLTAGTLNFMSATALADVFAGFANANVFSINGGIIDNLSGSAATLNLGSSGKYSLGGNFTFTGSSSLSFGNNAVTLTGNRTVTNVANTLTIGGVISGSGYGLTKTGAGTLALTGANTYTGSTTIKAGKLITTTASNGGGNYTVTNGSTLNVQAAVAGQSLNTATLTLGAGGADSCSLQIDAGALGNPTVPVINATNLAVNGAVTVNLYGTALTPGTYTILTNSPGLRTGGGSFTLSTSPRMSATLNDDTANNCVTITFTAIPDSGIIWDGSAGGNWDLNDRGNLTWKGNNSGAATDYLENSLFGNDTVLFNDSAAGTTTVNLSATLSPQGLTVSNSAATVTANYVFSGSGKLSGTAGLTKLGSGTLTLAETGGDNFSGGLSVSNGTLILDNAGSAITGNTTIGSGATLQVGHNDANGGLPPGTLTDNGSVIFSQNANATVSSVISGMGVFAQNGSATLTLNSGNNSFTGGVTVNSGVLQVSGTGGNSSLGKGAATVSAGGILVGITNDAFGYNANDNPTNINILGTVTDLGTASYRITLPNLTFTGGTLTSAAGNAGDVYGNYSLNGNNTACTVSTVASGTTAVISAGGISIQKPTVFNVAAGSVTGGATPGVDLFVSSPMLVYGVQTVTKAGPGVLALSGANTYTGNTIVSNGVLKLVGVGSLASPLIAVTNGATLDVSSLSSPFTLNYGQTLGGNGVVKGNVTTSGQSLIDAGLYGGGTLNFLNNLTLNYNATNRFILSPTTSGANSGIVVAGTLDVSAGYSMGGVMIHIDYTTLQNGRYKLITYGSLTGSLADLTLTGYIAGGRQTAVLDNSLPGEIDLVVSGTSGNLTWQGNGSNNNWDSGTTLDWSNNVTHVSDYYFDGDVVTFNDFGSQIPSVNLTGPLQPASILVANNSGTYTFIDANGLGKITGPTALVKQGAGSLALMESGGDDFSGGITVGGGALILSNNSVNLSGGVTVTNGSVTLAHNGTIAGGLTMNNSAGGVPSAQIIGNGTLNGSITAAGSLVISNAPNIYGNLAVNSGTTLLDEDSIPIGNTTIASGAAVQVGNNDYTGNLPSGTLTMNGTLTFNFNVYDNVTIAKVIAGAATGSLIKTNLNQVTLSAANTFTGAVAVVQGILQAGNAVALGRTNSGTTVFAGATLDVNGFALGAEPVTVSGVGMTNLWDGSTNGAINNSSATAATPALNYITLTGNTVFGATGGRWDLGSAAGPTGDPATSRLDTGSQPYSLTKVGSQFFGLRAVTVDPQLGDVDVQAGTLNIEGNTTGLGNSSSNLFVRNGATLEFYNMTNQLNKQIKLDDGATVLNGAGTNTVTGPVTLAGTGDTFNVGGSILILNGPLGGTGALTKTGTNTLILTAPGNNYTGNTTINAGTLALKGAGLVPSAGTINLNTANLDVSQESGAFTLTANTLTTASASKLVVSNSAPASIGTFNMNDSLLQIPVTDAGTASVIATNLNFGGSSNFVSVTVLGPSLRTQFPLIKYTSVTGFNVGVSNILPAAGGYLGFISNNVANHSIDLVLTGSGNSLVWNGGDSAVNTNWSDALNWSAPIDPGNNLFFGGMAGLINNNDTLAGTPYLGITFNTDAGAFVLNGNPITLNGNITNNSSNPQTINLPVSIAGNPILNAGTAGLTLAGGITNTSSTLYTLHLQGTNGTIAGPLQSSAAGLPNNLAVTLDNVGVSNNWSLVGNNTSCLTNLNVIGGSLTIGTGADSPALFITNTSTSGDIMDLGNATNATGVLNMNSGSLFLIGTRYVQLGNVASSTGIINQSGGTVTVATSAGIDVANQVGAFGFINITGGTFDTSGGGYSVTLRGTGSLNISGTGLVRVNTLNMTRNNADSVNASGTLLMNHETLGNAATGQTGAINFNGGVLQAVTNSASFMSSAAAPSVFTTTVKAGGAIINDGGFAITNSSPLVHDATLNGSADGGLVKTGSGTLTLAGANTYTGNTVISNGTLAVGGSLAAAGAVTVSANGTLSGTGIVGGKVTVNGTLAPGTPATAGLLTCSANVMINGTNTMKLDKGNLTNDVLSVGGTLMYGGTLNVSVLSGTPALNDSFQLFSATSHGGDFAAINLPGLDAGLGWSWDPARGTLSVVPAVSVNLNPTNITAAVAGNVLQLSWPADHTGWRLLVQTNHLASGISSNTNDWTEVPGSAGMDQTNITINPALPAVFYRLVYP
jgi:autotransporter-associated beta strand protein